MTSPVKIWRNQAKIRKLLGRKGKISSWTVVRVPPEGFSSLAPYIVGVAMMEDETRIIAPVVDCEFSEIKEGMKVDAVLRRMQEVASHEVIQYGIKLKPSK